MNVKEALQLAKKRLKQCEIESYAIDAKLILKKATALSEVELYTKENVVLTQEQQSIFLYDLEQREQHKPMAYITGICEFMGLPFVVQEGVLIPRADTETLVETVLQYHKKEHFTKIIDICTGTGCIAISLAKYSNIALCGTDISNIALETAQKNAQKNHVLIKWLQSNLLESVPKQHFDAIVSNPPYIATEEIQTLMKSVKDFEPHLALDGGKDGFYFYQKIVEQGKQYLKQGGWIFFEIGYQQANAVCNILKQNGFLNHMVYQDLAGLDRVVAFLCHKNKLTFRRKKNVR